MRLKKVVVRDFKRFTDLTVEGIPREARLIMLAGPNGSGKSSFFEALNTWHRHSWRGSGSWDQTYHFKASSTDPRPWTGKDVTVEFHEEVPADARERKKAFYVRSAYRNDPQTDLTRLMRSGDLVDQAGVARIIDNDATVGRNYQRMAGQGLEDIYEREDPKTTIGDFRQKAIGDISIAFQKIFPDLELNSLGNPLAEGTFRFTKGASQGFLFKNLSGGEKAAFDLILDLDVSRQEYDNTVFCVDEPEAHMSTRLQADLLSALFDLVPDNCQLMLATHSIGMMRRARDIVRENPGSVAFLDFGGRDFDRQQTIEPIQPDRSFWHRAYSVALDDLAALVAPRRVVICEGAPRTPKPSKNHSNDARCYDAIFEMRYPDTRFVSAGNANEVSTDRLGLAEALRSLVDGLEIVRLIDRDDKSQAEILEDQNRGVRVLSRRNLEAYLFDDEVLLKLATSVGMEDKTEEVLAVKQQVLASKPGPPDDLKAARGEIYVACKEILELFACGNTVEAFMRDTLAPLICPEMRIYEELHRDIFDEL